MTKKMKESVEIVDVSDYGEDIIDRFLEFVRANPKNWKFRNSALIYEYEDYQFDEPYDETEHECSEQEYYDNYSGSFTEIVVNVVIEYNPTTGVYNIQCTNEHDDYVDYKIDTDEELKSMFGLSDDKIETLKSKTINKGTSKMVEKKINESGYLNATPVPSMALPQVADDWYISDVEDDEFNVGIDANVAPMVGAQGGAPLATMSGATAPVPTSYEVPAFQGTGGLDYLLQMAGVDGQAVDPVPVATEPVVPATSPVDDDMSLYGMGFDQDAEDLYGADEVGMTDADFDRMETMAALPDVPDQPQDEITIPSGSEVDMYDGMMTDDDIASLYALYDEDPVTTEEELPVAEVSDPVVDNLPELEDEEPVIETDESANPEDMVVEKQPVADETEKQQLVDYLVHNKEILYGPNSTKAQKYRKEVEGKSVEELRVEAEDVSPNWKQYIGKYKVDAEAPVAEPMNEGVEINALYDEYTDMPEWKEQYKAECDAVLAQINTTDGANYKVVSDSEVEWDGVSEHLIAKLEKVDGKYVFTIADKDEFYGVDTGKEYVITADTAEEMASTLGVSIETVDSMFAKTEILGESFVIKAIGDKGDYGFLAIHPEEPDLPYFVDEIEDAIHFENMEDAEIHAQNLEYASSDFDFEVVRDDESATREPELENVETTELDNGYDNADLDKLAGLEESVEDSVENNEEIADNVEDEVPEGQEILTEEEGDIPLEGEDFSEVEEGEEVDESLDLGKKMKKPTLKSVPSEMKESVEEAVNVDIKVKEYGELKDADLNHSIKDNEPVKDTFPTGEEVKFDKPVKGVNCDVKEESGEDYLAESHSCYSVKFADGKVEHIFSPYQLIRVMSESTVPVEEILTI